MSLRDWFAGQALANLLRHGVYSPETDHLTAHYAYGLADAMLKAREKEPK
jgi:hypothetical protein